MDDVRQTPETDRATNGTTRRQVIVAAGVGVGSLAFGGVLAACGSKVRSAPSATVDHTLRVQRATVDLGGRMARTWTYDGRLPGPELRLRQGRSVRVRVVNDLDEPTSVHWHGIRLRNPADGVPGFTQPSIKPGGDFVYEFTPPDAGTYMLHSHVGVQLDRGLYAPLIVEPRVERTSSDVDVTLMFDDWLDGLPGTPDRRLAELRGSGMQMGGMSGMAGSGTRPKGAARHTDLAGRVPAADSLPRLANDLEAGRLDPGDVPDYPLYLINGRPPNDPEKVMARRGERVRLRLVNPSADTIFCVFVEGHELEVIAADGLDVEPVKSDALVLGMGERYVVVVQAKGGAPVRIFGMPLGKRGRAVGLLRFRDSTAPAPPPAASFRMPRRVLSYEDLRPVAAPAAGLRTQARVIRLDLAMGRGPYAWTIGGQAFPDADTITVDRGEHVRFVMRNRTKMPHPMHLHGHSFTVNGVEGPLKDTALALPNRELTIDWVADNPGSWAFHCHNVYHQEAGMMRRVLVR